MLLRLIIGSGCFRRCRCLPFLAPRPSPRLPTSTSPPLRRHRRGWSISIVPATAPGPLATLPPPRTTRMPDKFAGLVGWPVDPASEWIALRHAVEHQQGSARRVSAEGAERNSLTGGMTAPCIGTAEQLHTRDALQDLVELMTWRLRDPPRGDPVNAIDLFRLGFRQSRASDHDGGRWGRHGFCHWWLEACREALVPSSEIPRRDSVSAPKFNYG